jgi:hypothetical protein
MNRVRKSLVVLGKAYVAGEIVDLSQVRNYKGLLHQRFIELFDEDENETFDCSNCERRFDSKDGLKFHFKQVHPGEKKAKKEEG